MKTKRKIIVKTFNVSRDTEDEFREEVVKLKGISQQAKDLNNEANRQITVVRNLFKKLIGEKGYTEAEGKVSLEGMEYYMAASQSEKINTTLWYQMLNGNAVSIEQFLAALSVNKAAAILSVGADQVAAISEITTGKTLSFRTKDISEIRNSSILEVYSNKPPPKFKKKKNRVLKGRLKV